MEALKGLSATLEGIENGGSILRNSIPPLDTLASYYQRLNKLAAGYGSDPRERQTHQQIISGWQQEVEQLGEILIQR